MGSNLHTGTLTLFFFFWQQWRSAKSQFSSLQQWWDVGKIQQFCKQHHFNVTRETTQSIKDLETSIVELQSLSASTGNRGHFQALKVKKATLVDLLGLRAQGALVRSRFQNVFEMDAPSKFFFNLEKKNGQSWLIHCLRSVDGRNLTQSSDIRKRAVDFFSQLYASEYNEDQLMSELFFDNLPQVAAQDSADLEGPLIMQELQVVLMSMENGKTPGLDGLPLDFYKSFWPTLGEDLFEVLSVSGGRLPLSCRRAVLTLLPKKGDLCEIKNWRLVSLVCRLQNPLKSVGK